MTSWLLPDHIADMLPRQTRELERLRAKTLAVMVSHGFEVIRPPMFEFLDSLITGTGTRLDRTTIKFVDEGSGRLAGFRADITPQAARIDAHILNRKGVTRLCYAGSVLHAKARHPLATRQPYVVGAEAFGVNGREADLEMIRLAVSILREIGLEHVNLAIGHTGIVRAFLAADPAVTEKIQRRVISALGDKDPAELAAAAETLSEKTRTALESLCLLYGGDNASESILSICRGNPEAERAAEELAWLAARTGADSVTLDGAAVAGFDYYTGVSFAGLCENMSEPVLRGGRYDGIGAAFGRFRPAVGFTLYLRDIAVQRSSELPEAIVAPGTGDDALDAEVARLRSEGRIVVQMFPGEDPDDLAESFRVTGRMVFEKGQWRVVPAGAVSIEEA